MKFINHVKIAGLTGFLIGFLIGIVDILSKILTWSFQWFEFYLLLLTSILIVGSIFIISSIFAELIIKLFKLKFYEDTYKIFYFASAISFLLLFYGMIYVHIFLLKSRTFTDQISIILSIVVVLVSILPYLLLLKGKKLMLNIIPLYNKKNIKKMFGNLVFIVLTFIIISFIMDIYLLNSFPAYKSGNRLDDKPNIILVIVDATRADHLSLYGYPLKTTPNLDKFSENAVVFENAISTSDWTLESTASIMTGKYPYRHNAIFTHELIDSNQTLISEILRDKGYVTAHITGDVFVKAKYGFWQGFITIKDRLDFFEYIHSYDKLSLKRFFHGVFPKLDNLIFKADDERPSEDLNKDIFKWLDKNKDQKFFLSITYYDPHDPYTLGIENKKRFTDKNFRYSEVEKAFSAKRYAPISKDMVDYIKGIYDTEIFYWDSNLGKLFDKLEQLGIKDNAIIIITADHGVELYEHGDFGNGLSLYQEVIHPPLVIYYPKEFTPKRITQRVSHVDIFPTILEMLNITIPKDTDGISLVPLMTGRDNYSREFILSEIWGSWDKPNNIKSQRAIIKAEWKLIEITPPQKTLPSSLFNLKIDPGEKTNLYDSNKRKREELKSYLENLKNN